MGNRETRRVADENDVRRCIRRALDLYLRDLDGERPAPLHDMVIASVESTLLQYVLEKAEGNQSQAAEILGMNRNTLRKKLKFFGLI